MHRRILRLAIPNIISNITVPLLGMVDLAILGHLDSEKYLGAVGLGSLIFNFIYWGLSFLRMGTSGLTAQELGRRHLQGASDMLSRSLLIGSGAGLGLILLQWPIAEAGFFLLEGSPEVENIAREYYYIRIWAAPATIGLYAFTGWFIGMQNAWIPMIITLFVNLLNAGLDYFFVFNLDMHADGVALGTVISQYLGFFLAAGIFIAQFGKIRRLMSWKEAWAIDAIRNFFKVNKDIFIRTVLLIFTLSFFTSKSASVSDTFLAVNTLLLQYLMLFSFITDGFAYAAEALTGKFKGAKDYSKLNKSIKFLFLWGFSLSIPFTLIYLIYGDGILRLLTDNHSIIAAAKPFLFWVALIPIISFPAFIWDGVFIGTTTTSALRNSMLISTILVFLPSFYLGNLWIGNHGLWLALILFMLSRGLTLTFLRKNIT